MNPINQSINQSISIPFETIDEDELESLVQSMAAVKGADWKIEKHVIVHTDDPSLLAALRALFPSDDANTTPVKQPRKRVNKPKGEGLTRGPHVKSISVNGSGEMISRFELNKRLAEKTIAEGTELHSPKHRYMRVMADGDGLVLVNADGEKL